MPKKHKLTAYLSDDVDRSKPEEFRALVNYHAFLGLPEINGLVAQKLGPNVTSDLVDRIISLWMNTVFDHACRGYAVKTKWFRVRAFIRGRFTGPEDQLAEGRHKVELGIALGFKTRDLGEDIDVELVKHETVLPAIERVTDEITGSINSTLTPGGKLYIHGNRIMVAGTGITGVGFVNAVNGRNAAWIREGALENNNPAEVVVNIPGNLPVGAYRVEIDTQFSWNGAKLRAEPLKIAFAGVLNVAKT